MVCSPGSQRSVSRGTVHSRSRSRSQSRSGSIQRSYTHSNHSRSPSRSFSRHSSHSHRSGRSGSRSHYSRSRSHSDHRHSRSWTRSRSRTRDRSAYSSRSRSVSRSRSRSSYRGSRRKSFFRSRSRSCSYHSDAPSRSRSHTPASRNVSPSSKGGRDPRDRSKRAQWTNNIWLVGEKAKDTVFHFCDICDLPIVIYGRLLPCKHVLCYTCAMNIMNKCKRCQKSVQTVERCLVGGIFMCFESDACRRTYLSQRDLQAHIDHRHRTGLTSGNGGVTVTTTANNNSNDNNNNNSNSNTNTSMSETIISVTSQQMNFSDGGTSLLPGGVKTTATPTNSHTVTTTIPMLDKITVSNAQMSLLGPSPRMIMNTMIPPNCTTTPPNIFINSQKSGGLLPLPPTQTTLPVAVSSSLLHSTRPPMPMPSAAGSSIGIMNRPAGINNPSVIGSNSSGGGNPIGPGNFPHLQSFANCPPPTMQPSSQPIGRPNMPLPQPAPPSTFLANSLPGGQLSSSTHNQNFNGASAVAALAAVVSAAMSAVQSKNTGGGSTGGIGGTNLPGGIQQQPLTNSQLQQHNSLNVITNALRAANPNWNAMMANALNNSTNNNNNNNNNSNHRLNTTNNAGNNNSSSNNNNNKNNNNNFNPRCLPFQ